LLVNRSFLEIIYGIVVSVPVAFTKEGDDLYEGWIIVRNDMLVQITVLILFLCPIGVAYGKVPFELSVLSFFQGIPRKVCDMEIQDGFPVPLGPSDEASWLLAKLSPIYGIPEGIKALDMFFKVIG